MRKILYTALMTAALVIISSAAVYASGWAQENGTWVYYNDNGTKVTNAWKTSSDGGYYYLDSSGYMLTNAFIDERYVDYDGRMVTSAWRQIDGYWYYFDSNGKMIYDKSKQINGVYYFFGDEGYMLTGWIEDDDEWYYCDPDDGHMYAAEWALLEPSEYMDIDDDDDTSVHEVESTGCYWFYFRSTGKAAKADGSEEYEEYTIGDSRYAFDMNGRLCTGWTLLEDTTPAIAGYKYYNDDESLGTYGAAHTGWLSAYPPEDEDEFGEDVEWFYFNAKGVPYYGENLSTSDDDETLNAKLKRITQNGKTNSYLFNERGNPVYGLRKVQKSDGTVTSMYFGTKEESCLQYGETKVTEADGTVSSFHFTSAGYGTNGVASSKLYYMGKLQKAIDDTYAYYTVDDKTYLVNKSGKIVKNHNSKKDEDEVEYRSNSSGLRDGGTADESELEEPEFYTTDDY